MGYKLVFYGLQYRADVKMDNRLEKEHYTKDETITLKIPISLPYQFQTKGFKRISGNFEHEGEFYNLIKQKLERDTLYVICIRNSHKTAISKKRTNFEKALNNWATSSNKTYKLLHTFIKDYVSNSPMKVNGGGGWTTDLLFYEGNFKVSNRNFGPLLPPPKLITS